MNLQGNVTTGLERVGDTLRRPAGPWTDSVDALLAHLHDAGFEGAPRPLGRDAQGRQVLEFVPGETGDERGTYSPAELESIGRMLADLHAALATFTPPATAHWNVVIPPDHHPELLCHNDVAPWNLVRSPRGWVLIDWDNAGPSSRLWDLAYSAQSMCGLRADRPVPESVSRLDAFLGGYGLPSQSRPALAVTLGRRARAMHDMLSASRDRQPWARIFAEDGPYWRATADHLDAHAADWAG